MDKRWKNLLLLGVLILVVAAAAFIILQPGPGRAKTFGEEFEEMKAFFAGKGIDAGALDIEDLAALSSAELAELKVELQSFASSFNGPGSAKELAGVYVSAIDLGAKSKAQGKKTNQIDALSLQDYCSNIVLFKERDSLEEEKIGLLEQLKTNINSFVGKYSNEAQQIGLKPLEVDIEALRSANGERATVTAQLEGAC